MAGFNNLDIPVGILTSMVGRFPLLKLGVLAKQFMLLILRDVFILAHNVCGMRKNIGERRTFIRKKVRIITRYGQKLN